MLLFESDTLFRSSDVDCFAVVVEIISFRKPVLDKLFHTAAGGCHGNARRYVLIEYVHVYILEIVLRFDLFVHA